MKHLPGKIGKVHIHASLWAQLEFRECFVFPERAEAWARRLQQLLRREGARVHAVDHHLIVDVSPPSDPPFLFGRQAWFSSFWASFSSALSTFDKKFAPGDRVHSTLNGWRGRVYGVGLCGEVLLWLTHDRYGRPLRKPIRYHVARCSFNGERPAWTVEKLLTS